MDQYLFFLLTFTDHKKHKNHKNHLWYMSFMVKIMNPFRKRTGIFPSYFTGRENELSELREIYESIRNVLQDI